MKKTFSLVLMMLILFPIYGQIINGINYWDTNDSLRFKLNKSYIDKGFVFMDSLLIEKVNSFFNKNDSEAYNTRHTPFSFAMRAVISDSLNEVGIFSVRKAGIHSQTYLLIKKNNKVRIISSRKNYEYYRLLKFIRNYIKKNDNLFTSEEKIQVWERLSNLMSGYNFLFNDW